MEDLVTVPDLRRHRVDWFKHVVLVRSDLAQDDRLLFRTTHRTPESTTVRPPGDYRVSPPPASPAESSLTGTEGARLTSWGSRRRPTTLGRREDTPEDREWVGREGPRESTPVPLPWGQNHRHPSLAGRTTGTPHLGTTTVTLAWGRRLGSQRTLQDLGRRFEGRDRVPTLHPSEVTPTDTQGLGIPAVPREPPFGPTPRPADTRPLGPPACRPTARPGRPLRTSRPRPLPHRVVQGLPQRVRVPYPRVGPEGHGWTGDVEALFSARDLRRHRVDRPVNFLDSPVEGRDSSAELDVLVYDPESDRLHAVRRPPPSAPIPLRGGEVESRVVTGVPSPDCPARVRRAGWVADRGPGPSGARGL